jgi:hypothetical protein
MLQEIKLIDKMEINQDGSIQVREATRILKDGEQIAQTFHRTSLTPGQDVSDQPANVQAIAAAAWTPEVIAAYNSAELARQAELNTEASE